MNFNIQATEVAQIELEVMLQVWRAVSPPRPPLIRQAKEGQGQGRGEGRVAKPAQVAAT